ncbi:MAG TPA: glycosyltransferase family 4 protein [Candidatus Binataceae bacterium]|nr:glycosyltransferase family 4 protein [Candidatus Binataceae bacterium]
MAAAAGGTGRLNHEARGISALDILYVGTLPPHSGGSAVVGYQLLAGLARMGHRVRAIAPITPETIDAGDGFSRRHPEICLTRFLVPFFNSSPDRIQPQSYLEAEDRAVRGAFHDAVRDRRPDLLIIGRESFAQSLPELASTAGIRSMLLVHGSGLFGMVHWFAPRHRDHLVEQFRRVDRVVAVARHLIDGPLRELGLRDVAFVPNPVDLRRFAPAPKSSELMARLGIRDDHFVIAHLSNMKPIKRASDIIRCAPEVIARVPNARYVIVGDGISRDDLEAEVRARGISDHFRFVGWVDHESVPDYINLSDAVVMPSQSEAAALVYLETMACARLLIASDIPGAREIIRDGKTGLLFRMGDNDDLTAKLVLAAVDPGLRQRIGRAACDAAKAHDVESFVADYERMICSLVEHRRADR